MSWNGTQLEGATCFHGLVALKITPVVTVNGFWEQNNLFGQVTVGPPFALEKLGEEKAKPKDSRKAFKSKVINASFHSPPTFKFRVYYNRSLFFA